MDLLDTASSTRTAAFTLGGEVYLHPTPAGTYFAVSRADTSPERALLQHLLRQHATPRLTGAWLQTTTGLDEAQALALLHRLQEAGYVQGLPQPMTAPTDAVNVLFPSLMQPLSDEGRAVLADEHSLLLAAVGWRHGHCEQLAALCGQLALLQQRHAGLRAELGLESDGWGLNSAAGFAELTFWPLYVGGARYHLVVGGQPRFNQQVYTKLVWALARREETRP